MVVPEDGASHLMPHHIPRMELKQAYALELLEVNVRGAPVDGVLFLDFRGSQLEHLEEVGEEMRMGREEFLLHGREAETLGAVFAGESEQLGESEAEEIADL